MIIYVLDTSFVVLSIIEEYYSLNWAERYFEAGDFELELPIEYALDSSITFGNFLYIQASDRLMIIEDIKPHFSEDQTSLLVNGQSAESLLNRRVILNPITVSGQAEEIIYKFVKDHITSPLNLDRKISIFKSTFPAVSTDVEYAEQFEMQSVYDIVADICKSTNLGFKVSLENSELAFSVYEGMDRSYDQEDNTYVIFSDDFDNVIESSFYESQKDKINIVLVTTEDRVLELRRVFVWEESQSEPTDLDRFETVIEAGIQRDIGKPEQPDLGPGLDAMHSNHITISPITGIPKLEIGIHHFSTNGITVGAPTTGIPQLPEPEAEPVEEFVPVPLDGPILGVVGEDNLAAVGFTVTPTMDEYGGYRFFTAIGMITTPRLGIPYAEEWVHRATSKGITIGAPTIGVPKIELGIHHLRAEGITTTPVIAEWVPPPLTDEEVLAVMTTKGRLEIQQNKSVGLFEGDFDIQGNFKYGVDFFMGDIVQCNLEGRNVKARIVELVQSYTKEGPKSYVAMDFII